MPAGFTETLAVPGVLPPPVTVNHDPPDAASEYVTADPLLPIDRDLAAGAVPPMV
jgi:hypothetical protein